MVTKEAGEKHGYPGKSVIEGDFAGRGYWLLPKDSNKTSYIS